jgi:hypothetical protein
VAIFSNKVRQSLLADRANSELNQLGRKFRVAFLASNPVRSLTVAGDHVTDNIAGTARDTGQVPETSAVSHRSAYPGMQVKNTLRQIACGWMGAEGIEPVADVLPCVIHHARFRCGVLIWRRCVPECVPEVIL